MKKPIALFHVFGDEDPEKVKQVIKLLENVSDSFNMGLYIRPDAALEATEPSTFDRIREWASARGIYAKGDPKTQTLKLIEEVGELSVAILKNDKDGQLDAIGDCVVVLTNLAALLGLDIEHCIDYAYKQIADRKGSMQNGTFVKESIKELLDKPLPGVTIDRKSA